MKWTITTDVELSACAQQLWDDHHIATTEVRGWDQHGIDFHKLMVHASDPNDAEITTVQVGMKLMLRDGKSRAIDIAELEAWG